MGYQGRKNRKKSREEKVSTENKTGKNQQTGTGGVQGWGETREGTVAYGFFQQTAVRWQAGDVTYWKAEVLQSSLPK